MHTLDLEGRRYRRSDRRVPVRLEGCSGGMPVLGESINLSTGGARVEIPMASANCAIGDRIHIEIEIDGRLTPFATAGTVRSLTPVAGGDGTSLKTQLGLQFREALLPSAA